MAPTPTLEFGCRLEMGLDDYEVAADLARRIESAGFDHLWVRDHVAVPETTNNPNSLECFTTLAGLARDTTSIRLGSLVVCNHWRNPALVAKMGAGIDVMSGGRLILGVGAGSSTETREFTRYGWDVPPPGERVAALDESLSIWKAMWTQAEPVFHGRHHRIDGAICAPAPQQRPHPPILVAAAGERALKVVVRHADIWNSAGPWDHYHRRVATLDRLCEQAGRDPADIVRCTNLNLVVADTTAEARRRADVIAADNPMAARVLPHSIVGDPSVVGEAVARFVDVGTTWFVAYFWDPDPAAQADSIAGFGELLDGLGKPA